MRLSGDRKTRDTAAMKFDPKSAITREPPLVSVCENKGRHRYICVWLSSKKTANNFQKRKRGETTLLAVNYRGIAREREWNIGKHGLRGSLASHRVALRWNSGIEDTISRTNVFDVLKRMQNSIHDCSLNMNLSTYGNCWTQIIAFLILIYTCSFVCHYLVFNKNLTKNRIG